MLKSLAEEAQKISQKNENAIYMTVCFDVFPVEANK